MEVEVRCSLSNLPDEILHHILSFLNIRNIARLRVLSRRFQTLCITAPSFSFSEPPKNLRFHDCSSCTNVFNFMNTLPQHRPRALKIEKLCFSSFCKTHEHRSLHEEWINKLFGTFHVDELYLYYQLPSIFGSLSRFQSLKVLKLDMRGLASVKLPLEVKLASLETLQLRYFETEDSVSEWVSHCFPFLKTLSLGKINVASFLIRSSRLEDLSIQSCCHLKVVRILTENLRALSYVNVNDESVVEIFAPNLQYLSWSGDIPKHCYDARTCKSLHVTSFTELRFKNLNLTIQLFEAARWSTLLHIDTHMLLDLYGMPSFSFGNVPDIEILVTRWFYHYKSFSVSEEGYDTVGDVLITFMKIISNTETLNFVSEPSQYFNAEPEEYGFKEAVKMCGKRTKWKEIKGLKKVKFKIRTMYHSMAFLIGMLKTRCLDLEEMTLIYPSCYHESITLYLNSLESASSALSINCASF